MPPRRSKANRLSVFIKGKLDLSSSKSTESFDPGSPGSHGHNHSSSGSNKKPKAVSPLSPGAVEGQFSHLPALRKFKVPPPLTADLQRLAPVHDALLNMFIPRPPEPDMTHKCSVCTKSDASRRVTLADGSIELLCGPCLTQRLASQPNEESEFEDAAVKMSTEEPTNDDESMPAKAEGRPGRPLDAKRPSVQKQMSLKHITKIEPANKPPTTASVDLSKQPIPEDLVAETPAEAPPAPPPAAAPAAPVAPKRPRPTGAPATPRGTAAQTLAAGDLREAMNAMKDRQGLLAGLKERAADLNPSIAAHDDKAMEGLDKMLLKRMRRLSGSNLFEEDTMAAFTRMSDLQSGFAWSDMGKVAHQAKENDAAEEEEEEEEEDDDMDIDVQVESEATDGPVFWATVEEEAVPGSRKGSRVRRVISSEKEKTPMPEIRNSEPPTDGRTFIIPLDSSDRPMLLPLGALQWTKASHDRDPGTDAAQLSFKAGEWLCIIEVNADGWWKGATLSDIENGRCAKYIPSTFCDESSTWEPKVTKIISTS